MAGRLRAALLGANVGIISTARLIVGIASAHAEISTKEAADAYASHFIADFSGRFGKLPRSTFGAHWPLRAADDVDLIPTCWVLRCVSKVLTVQYGRLICLLEDTAANRGLIHSYLDVFEYPDGRIESRVNGAALCRVPYNRLSKIDQAAIVDNKRLGHTLQMTRSAAGSVRSSREAPGYALGRETGASAAHVRA